MEHAYADRKQSEKVPQEKENAELQGPSLAALSSGAAQPTPEQRGRQVSLPDAMRSKMENAFGADLGALRLYESQTVADVGSQAITQGADIAFAPGLVDFTSFRGQSLLGHEISHVVSQARGEVSGVGFLRDSALEARADREGAMAAAGEPIAMPAAALSPVSAADAAGPMQAKDKPWKKTAAPEKGGSAGAQPQAADPPTTLAELTRSEAVTSSPPVSAPPSPAPPAAAAAEPAVPSADVTEEELEDVALSEYDDDGDSEEEGEIAAAAVLEEAAADAAPEEAAAAPVTEAPVAAAPPNAAAAPGQGRRLPLPTNEDFFEAGGVIKPRGAPAAAAEGGVAEAAAAAEEPETAEEEPEAAEDQTAAFLATVGDGTDFSQMQPGMQPMTGMQPMAGMQPMMGMQPMAGMQPMMGMDPMSMIQQQQMIIQQLQQQLSIQAMQIQNLNEMMQKFVVAPAMQQHAQAMKRNEVAMKELRKRYTERDPFQPKRP